jgi:hypothetical protein
MPIVSQRLSNHAPEHFLAEVLVEEEATRRVRENKVLFEKRQRIGRALSQDEAEPGREFDDARAARLCGTKPLSA